MKLTKADLIGLSIVLAVCWMAASFILFAFGLSVQYSILLGLGFWFWAVPGVGDWGDTVVVSDGYQKKDFGGMNGALFRCEGEMSLVWRWGVLVDRPDIIIPAEDPKHGVPAVEYRGL